MADLDANAHLIPMPDTPKIVTSRKPRRRAAPKTAGPAIPQRIVVQESKHERARRKEAERTPDPEAEARVADLIARMTRPKGGDPE